MPLRGETDERVQPDEHPQQEEERLELLTDSCVPERAVKTPQRAPGIEGAMRIDGVLASRPDLPERRNYLSGQVLFSDRINPQTVFFLGRSDSHRGDRDIDLTQSGRTHAERTDALREDGTRLGAVARPPQRGDD